MNWDYIAGIFDGEGSATIYHDPKRRGGRDTIVYIQIAMTHKPTIDTIYNFLKENGMTPTIFNDRSPSRLRHPNWLPMWYVKIYRRKSVCIFLENMIARSITKQDKLMEMMDVIYGHLLDN